MAEVENLEKGAKEGTKDAPSYYTLRAYDRKLAESGFLCVVITGSHYPDSIIDKTDGDIKGEGTVKIDAQGKTKFEIDGTTYLFGIDGVCTNAGIPYRLMLAEEQPATTVESILKDINETLKNIDNTIAAYVESVDAKIKEAKSIAEEAKEATEGVWDSINDLDERVTALEEEN
jgi:hypothetical protein